MSRALDDMTAIVTGGASGIGLAAAAKLAAEGASVVLADLDRERAESAAADLRETGVEALAVACDVSAEDSVEAMVAAGVERFGSVGVLVNSAGLTSWEVMSRDKPIADAELDIWQRMMAVNLFGPMLCAKHAIPVMIEAGGGAIVNVSSIRSLEGSPMMNAYAASKAAVNILTRNIATAYGKRGIRANAVLPGTLLTPATAPLAKFDEGFFERLEGVQLLSRLASPEDVAEVIAFLASDRSFSLQGQLLQVDAGASAHQRMPAPQMTQGS
jgi:NAD(P)-dependent dehydrogenase (short-subunit alcohol dehydrogenase family)